MSAHPLNTSAEAVIQRQLEAYNARNLDAWLATYRDDAQQFLLHGSLLACGHEQIRKRMEDRFKDPALHARLLSRTVMDNLVVDHEIVTRSGDHGLLVTVEMICVYEVHEGRIAKASFAISETRPAR